MQISRRTWLQGTAAASVAATVATTAGRPRPAAAAAQAVTTLDLSAVHAYDVRDSRQALLAYGWLHAAATVQGIVNRDGPALPPRRRAGRPAHRPVLVAARRGGGLAEH